jgi:hydroxymethylglutaryl-CoA lyase
MLPAHVKIVEVGPRDGLQNEPTNVSTAVKIDFINRLSETGLTVIEATSFVSPKWIPQLADASEVLQGIHKKSGVRYPVLVPNVKGLDNALAAGAKDIAVFATPSEQFSQKNTGCSVAESMQRIRGVIEKARINKVGVRGYLSCVLGCPYEGEMRPEKVATLAKELYEIGCEQISLGDTIGVGTPTKTKILIDAVAKEVPVNRLAVHFHDTYGQALTNIYAALQQGVAIIDSSVAGLGGCPYAKGASGNVATEDVLYLLQGLQIETGVDLKKIVAVGQFITQQLGVEPRSKVSKAFGY